MAQKCQKTGVNKLKTVKTGTVYYYVLRSIRLTIYAFFISPV